MKFVYIFFTLLIIPSCNQTSKPAQEAAVESGIDHIAEIKWVCGIWTCQMEDGLITEKWERVNDSTLSGKGTVVTGGETVFSETISLHQNGSDLIYTAVVPSENNGKPVDFKMTSIGDHFAVFENPKHDFPQKIHYLHRNDSLIATVSGIDKGKVRSEVFALGKLDIPQP